MNDFAQTSSGIPLQPVYGPGDRQAAAQRSQPRGVCFLLQLLDQVLSQEACRAGNEDGFHEPQML